VRVKGASTARRTVAGFVIACWVVASGCLVTACGSAGSVRHAVGGLTSSALAGAGAAATGDATTGPPSTTAAPTSAPPTIAAPTSAPPTTAAPTTASPSSAPATSAPATTAAPSATANAPARPGSSLTWLWAALAAVAFIGLVAGLAAWVAHARGRRKAATTGWHARLIDAYAKGAALHDAMAAAEAPGALGSPDTAARWADIQRRADDFTQLLYALRESAADGADSIRIADTLAALQAVRSAMEAERSGPGPHDAMMANVVRDRLSFFRSALGDLRAPPGGRA
jgi:hypothetical protein